MRKNELSFMNVALCLLVIFIHVASVTINELDKGSISFLSVFLPWRLSAFVVQGFVFLSAVKFFQGKEAASFTYKPFLLTRIQKILLPYSISVTVFYIYFVWHSYFPFSLRALLQHILVGDLVSHFYFVVIIFQFYLLMPLWRKLVEKVNGVLAFVVAVLFTILFGKAFPPMLEAVSGYSFIYNDRIFTTYLCYWVAGCYVGKHYDACKTVLWKNRGFVVLVFLSAVLANGYFSYGHALGWFQAPFLEDIHFIYCFAAIATLLLIGIAWGGLFQKHLLFRALDRCSYSIYLYHILLIFECNDYFVENGIHDYAVKFFVKMIAVYAIIVLLSSIYTAIIEKRRALR